jgi:uncharacterized protein DUF6939
MARRAADRFARCVFLPYSSRANVPPGAVVIDVSSYADPPFCTLSPMWAHGGIPVPGLPGTTSDSVEGIWQGLKVIRGRTEPRYFRGKGAKRGGKPSGHRLGDRLLDIVEARRRIYIPAYEWVLENRVEPAVVEGFLERARRGVVQYVHDVGDNGDLGNADEGLAHAAVLVRYLNRRLAGG